MNLDLWDFFELIQRSCGLNYCIGTGSTIWCLGFEGDKVFPGKWKDSVWIPEEMSGREREHFRVSGLFYAGMGGRGATSNFIRRVFCKGAIPSAVDPTTAILPKRKLFSSQWDIHSSFISKITAPCLQGFGGYKALPHTLACVALWYSCEEINTRELMFYSRATGQISGGKTLELGPWLGS